MSSQQQNFRQQLIISASSCGIILSKEDLRTVNQSRTNSRLHQWVERNLGQPLSSDGTDELESSTDGIRRQCQALEKQQGGLEQLDGCQAVASQDVSKYAYRFDLDTSSEAQNLKFEIQQSLRQLQEAYSISQLKIEKNYESIPNMINVFLNNQDRVLGTLFQTLPDAMEKSTYETDLARVEKLTSKLHDLSVEELQDRLDRIYLESLPSDTFTDAEILKDENAAEQLRGDLSSLYSEISDLTSICISQQHAQPILDVLNALETEHRQNEIRKRLEIENNLLILTYNIDDLITALKKYQSYRLTRQVIHTHTTGFEPVERVSQGQKSPRDAMTAAITMLLQHHGITVDHESDEQDLAARMFAKVGKTRQQLSKSSELNEQTMKEAFAQGQAATEPLENSKTMSIADTDVVGLQHLDERLSRLKTQVEILNMSKSENEVNMTQHFVKKWK